MCLNSLCKIICRHRLDAGSILVTLAQHRTVSCANDMSCYCYSRFVLLESFAFISLPHVLKLIIAARQHSSAIYNTGCYCSLLMVYCVDIILRLNDFIILRFKFVVFTLVHVIVFTVILMPFYCVFLIIYWREIFYECICFFILWESDITKLFNRHFFRWYWSLHNTLHWTKKKCQE